ncbi:MAG TPA: hypothetical protein VF274_00800 [Alphaproteobacteria bacterium]
MTARTRSLAAVLAGMVATALLMAGPAHAAGKKTRVDTKPGCFGAGNQGHTRERLEQARGLKILSVHGDVTGIKVVDNKNNTVFKGMPKVGQVIPISGMRFAYLEATTRGANGCLVKYAPQ